MGSSGDSNLSTTDHTSLNDPSLLLIRRINELSISVCKSRPRGETITALNRKLDDVEDILFRPGQLQKCHTKNTMNELNMADGALSNGVHPKVDGEVPTSTEAGTVVLKFGGTSVGKFAREIAQICL